MLSANLKICRFREAAKEILGSDANLFKCRSTMFPALQTYQLTALDVLAQRMHFFIRERTF
jgi:hypothetical protein